MFSGRHQIVSDVCIFIVCNLVECLPTKKLHQIAGNCKSKVRTRARGPRLCTDVWKTKNGYPIRAQQKEMKSSSISLLYTCGKMLSIQWALNIKYLRRSSYWNRGRHKKISIEHAISISSNHQYGEDQLSEIRVLSFASWYHATAHHICDAIQLCGVSFVVGRRKSTRFEFWSGNIAITNNMHGEIKASKNFKRKGNVISWFKRIIRC